MNKGFTLLEVMIALAIAALVFTMGAGILGQQGRHLSYLQQKLAADVAAKNLLDRHRMDVPENLKIRLTHEDSTISMAGFNFAYTQTLTPTQEPGLFKVDIVVYDEERTSPLRRLSMFAAK